MNQSVSLRQSVSPRFDNVMTRSNGLPWFPEPLNKSQRNTSSVAPISARSISLKSPGARSNNNDTYTKEVNSTFASNKSSDAMMGARFDKEKDIYTCIYISKSVFFQSQEGKYRFRQSMFASLQIWYNWVFYWTFACLYSHGRNIGIVAQRLINLDKIYTTLSFLSTCTCVKHFN